MDWTNEKATAKCKCLGDRALIILVGFLENLRITGCCRKVLWILGAETRSIMK